MNKKFTKLMAALALLACLTIPLGMRGQTRDEIAKYTFATEKNTSNTAYATDYNITVNGIQWSCPGNQNNEGFVRIGGKNLDGVERNIFSKAPLHGNNPSFSVSKITVNHKGKSNDNFIVNSVKVVVATNSSFSDVVEEITLTPTIQTSTEGSFDFIPTSNWSSSNYYKFVFNVTNNKNSNYGIDVASIVFYEITGPITYSVMYNGNGADGGTAVVDPDSPYEANATVTVLVNTFTKTGHTFAWWSDMEDGTDDDANLYEEGDTFEISENTTLYAQWSVNTYNYTLNVTGDDDEAMAELEVDGSTVSQGAKIAYDKEVTIVVATNNGYNYSIEVKDANNNDITVANNKFTMPASDVTVTVTTVLIPTYTITFETGTGASVAQISDLEGSTISLPTTTPSQTCVSRGWTFAGWATASVSETTTAPTLLNGDYTIIADATLYAVYKVTEGDGGTIEFNFASIANANGWENSVAYTSVVINPVTIEAQGGGNNGKWYTTGGGSWRMYSGGTVSVSAGDKAVTNVESLPECVFSISNGIATFSPSARTDFTSITVTYGTSTTTYNSNPSCLEIVATPTFTVAAGTYTSAQTVEINCGTTGASIYYTLDGSEPNNQSTPYNGAISIATSTTLKAIATNDGMDDSEIATAEYVIQYILTVSKDHVGFGLYDYYVDEDEQEHWDDIDVNDQTGTALVRSGANVRISVEDVGDCYLLQGFNVVDGDNNPVQVDNLMEEDGTYSFIMPASNATLSASVNSSTEYTLTVEGLENASFTQLLVGSGGEAVTLDNNHQATICEQLHVAMFGLTATTGHVIESVTLTYGGQTTEITPESGVYEFTMPSSNATLTITVGETPKYTLVTSEDQLVPGKHYIIVGSKTTSYYAMGGQNDNNRSAVEVTISNNTIEAVEGIYEFVISGPETIQIDDEDVTVYTIYDAGESGYLYAASSSKNHLKTESTLDNNGKWTIAIGSTTHVATITAQGDKTHNILKKNNSDDIFSCYSSGQNDVYLYVKDGDNNCPIYSNTNLSSDMTVTGDMNIHAGVVTVETSKCLTVEGTLTNATAANLVIENGAQLVTSSSNVQATVQKNIDAHGANAQEGGWNFIATPIVEGTTPLTTNGILSSTENDYDLFFYDEPTHYWRNYKNNDGNTSPGFNLRNGQGYLYANADDTQIEFTGTLRPSNAAYTNTLIYTSSVGNLAGWNLVGNPFACNATVTTTNNDSESNSCYVINGGAIVATTGTVAAPCSGVMVKATATGQTVTFTPTTDAAVFSTGHNQLNVTIANNMTARGESSMIDNAIVSFNENSQLEKFVFFEDNAKLYIPQGEKDYAIVSAEAQGEMPVCFKATKDGEYTITVSPEGVELNYLHLIDNMTGMDVDLLQTPSYTFEASTRDYESRFKLVFAGASTDSATDESFAYYDGSEWKVSNEGEATLQVVDVIGRIVKSETINGNFNLNLNQKAGVYMLRLINGENVKVQKVVVR